MFRSIAAVIAGYIAMFVIIICVLVLAYFGMGADLAYQPGSWHPTAFWLAVQIVVELLAAAAAGWLCITIARKRGAVTALAVVILVFGALQIVPARRKAQLPEVPRDTAPSNLEAMSHTRPPIWIPFLNPLLGVVGVVAGSRFKKT